MQFILYSFETKAHSQGKTMNEAIENIKDADFLPAFVKVIAQYQ
jgi:hypothetical protein